MDTTIKNINYRVRPPEDKNHGWIDGETLKVFNGKYWVAVGGDSPFHKGSSVELNPSLHKAELELVKGGNLTFSSPIEDGVEMTIVLHNASKGEISVNLPSGVNDIHLGSSNTITLASGKYALVKVLAMGDKNFFQLYPQA